MKVDVLDDGEIEEQYKANYPFYLFVVGFLNIVFTFLAYGGLKLMDGTLSIRVIESEGTLALIQASYWMLLMLVVDIIQAFRKVLKEGGFFKFILNVFLWILGSVFVTFFVTVLIFIPRLLFTLLVFGITSLSQVDFEPIILSVPYVLFTIVFIAGGLVYCNKSPSKEI